MGFLSRLGRVVESVGLAMQSRRRDDAQHAAQFRELLMEALEDPATARAAARRLALPILPIRGGQCTSASDISHGDFGASCGPDTGDYTFAGGGKVGIGTTSPAAPLDVTTANSTYSATGNAALRVTNTASSGQSPLDFVINGTLRGRVRTDYVGDLNLVANGGHFYFFTGGDFGVGTLSMILTSAGKLGIGASAPAAKVQIATASDTNPTNITAWDTRHLVAGQGGGTQGGVGISYDQTNNVGYLEALHPGVAWGNLVLQSDGGNVGIGTTNPIRPLHVKGGDIAVEGDPTNGGGFAMIKPGATETTSVLYRAGGSDEDQDVTILRTYRNAAYSEGEYTILNVLAPPETETFPTPKREATLTLERADDLGHSEFLDLYNNYYPDSTPPSTQYGIRIQKRNPTGDTNAQYHDSVFDQYDGNTSGTGGAEVYLPIMTLKADRTTWLKSHGDLTNTWPDSDAIHATAAIETTDSTATTLATITLDSPRVYQILVRVAARQSDGTNHALFFRTALLYNEGSGAFVQGGLFEDAMSPILSSGASAWALTLNTSGNNVNIQVQGGASATVYWVATIEYQSLSANS